MDNLATARRDLGKDRAQAAIKVVFGAMDTGSFVTRAFIVSAFQTAGYAPNMAERRADQLIMVNTDIDHWSRFRVRTVDGRTAYGWYPQMLNLNLVKHG